MIRFLAAVFLAAAQVAAAPDDVAAYRALIMLDARVATIGYRLAAANAEFCQQKGRNPGWVLHGIGQYPDQKLAQSVFQFGATGIAISAVVPNGPAVNAGLAAGDSLVNLANSPWDRTGAAVAGSDEKAMEQLRVTLNDMWRRQNNVTIEFSGLTGPKSLKFAPPEICASDFWVDTKSKLDAGADGDRVRLTAPMVEYVPNDNELAAVIAHELSHNILGHRQRLDRVKKGKTQAVLATEVEADQLSVWLMANAGYDPKAAARFWRRYGQQYGAGIFTAGTHYRWKKRVAILQAQIDMIAATPMNNGLRPPPLLTAVQK
jgi:beta-barrel assembly-enhancing protease